MESFFKMVAIYECIGVRNQTFGCVDDPVSIEVFDGFRRYTIIDVYSATNDIQSGRVTDVASHKFKTKDISIGGEGRYMEISFKKKVMISDGVPTNPGLLLHELDRASTIMLLLHHPSILGRQLYGSSLFHVGSLSSSFPATR